MNILYEKMEVLNGVFIHNLNILSTELVANRNRMYNEELKLSAHILRGVNRERPQI